MANAPLGAVLEHIRRIAAVQNGLTLTDSQLLDAFSLRHDEGAFAALVKRHGAMVLGVCRHVLHHQQDAEDAFQATFVVLARNAASVRNKEALSGWLHGVAYRMALSSKRAAARRRRHEGRAQTMPPTNPASELACREMQAILDEEIQRLPTKYRAPFVMCFLEGQSQTEVARQLGLNDGTLRSRLSRAREQLRARLSRRGVALSAVLGALALTQHATAAVPLSLTYSTIKVGLQYAAGGSAGSLSVEVAALVKGFTKAMVTTKVKVVALLVVALGGLAAGAGVLVQRQLTKQEPSQSLADQAKPSAPEADARQPVVEERARTDQFGDPLPAEAIARLGTARFRHGELVSYIAFSPDAMQLISQSDIIRVWETATGKELRHFTPLPGHKLGAGSLSPDGKVLAVGGLMNESDPIVLCEVATGGNLKEFGKGQYELVTFSPDGKTLAAIASRRGRFELWDVATGQRLHEWDAHGQAYAVAFARDGKTLLTSGRDKRVCFWDVATGRRTGEIKDCPTLWNPFGPATQVCLSPDGRRLAAIRPKEDNQLMPVNQIGIWDVATGKELCQLSAPKEEIASACWSGFWAVAWAANGELVTAGPDESVRIWDPVAARQVRRLRNASQFSLAVSGDGKHIAAGGESIRVIDLAKDPRSDVFPDLRAPGPPGDVFVAGALAVTAQGFAVLWDAGTGKELRRLEHPSGIATVHLSADGQILFAVCGDNMVRAWDTATGREMPDFEFKKANVRTQRLARTPDGKLLLAVARDNGDIDVFNADTGEKVQSLKGHQSYIYGLAFTPEARTLVVCFEDRTVEVRDVATGERLRQFSLPEDKKNAVPGRPVFTAALSPDGNLLAFGSQSRFLVLKDLITGQDVRRLDELPDGVCPLAFSPDGKTLAWAGWTIGMPPGWKDPAVHLVEVLTGQERRTLTGHGGRVLNLAFSGDGKRLISSGSDTTALIWDLSDKLSAGDRPQSTKEIEAAWVDLASDDAARAFQAIRRLAGCPQEAVSFLQKCLQPTAKVDQTRLSRLIADLDSNTFSVRESAMKELEKLGEVATPMCRNALAGKPSAEMRRRLKSLLEKQTRDWKDPPSEHLRSLRAIEALERMATSEAKQLLDSLAQGAPEARLTQEAKASLERLAGHR